MAYQMWKKGRNNDYRFIDNAIASQYNMGGVDMWLYTYIGPALNNNQSSDNTLNYNGSNGNLSKIGDLIFGETANRAYNLQAITLDVVYQIQEATADLKIPGLFFNFDTMDITLHYNTMMQRVGRKIMPGDVIELPNLRDFDVIGKDRGLNRFYVVQDGFRTAEGYSATWQHHIYKLRVKPLTASPEFSQIIGGDGDNDFPDNPDDPNNGNGNGDGNDNSNAQNELDIMNAIISQADDEVPYIHWTNEHIYDDIKDINELATSILHGYEYPVNPLNDMFFVKLTYPVLYEKDNSSWSIVQASYGNQLPRKAKDGDFFFLENKAERSGYSLYQYYLDTKKWVSCILPYTDTKEVPKDAEDFFCTYAAPQMEQYVDGKWIIPDPSDSTVPFTSKDIAANRTNPQDMRNMIPPARGTVGEGNVFPSGPKDGEYFYRTDLKPVTLWQYSDESKSWVQFNYGGRKPWVGPNIEQAKFINSPDRVSINDVVKPNTAYRIKKDK